MIGAVRWFARNGVAANLIMVLVLVGGLVTMGAIPFLGGSMKQEVFPEISLDLVTVRVPYLGAAPEEVEQSVCVRIEEAIQGIDGVKRVTSTAAEGQGVVTAELLLGADVRTVLDDVKARVDAIDTFPEETEKPVVRELTNRRQVIDVAVWGEADEKTLRTLGESLRDEIAALDGVTLTELVTARPYEISLEVSESALRRYGMTFDEVAGAVRRSSLDLPGGSLKTEGGEILLRAKGQAYRAAEFERLVLRTRDDGTQLRLGDVADVVDGFEDVDRFMLFNGLPAQSVSVFRVGRQDALQIADAVNEYVAEAADAMPEGIHLSTWNDQSRVLRDRRDLLVKNGVTGLVLVLVVLALFLRLRLAFWTAVGLFIAFVGTFWVMPLLGVSINLISLFAFILVLGIVVDDAIVVGENIYTEQRRLGDGLEGAVRGAVGVTRPVVFAVATTIAAFAPLLNVAGYMGKIFRVIPLIVIPCLLWSLVESLFVLPNHLSHYVHRRPEDRSFVARKLEAFVERVYRPVLHVALEWRYLTIAVALATLLVTVGLVAGGKIRYQFFPDVESDFITVALTMPPGTPVEKTAEGVRLLRESSLRVREAVIEQSGEDPFVNVVSSVGSQPFRAVQSQNAGARAGVESSAHLGELTIELIPSEVRTVSSAELLTRWRRQLGGVPDAIEVAFSASLFSPGSDIDVELTGPDIEQLQSAAVALAQKLADYDGVFDVADSFRPGKRQLELDILPRAEVAGLTLEDLSRQVRQAFYGEEVQRIQRGRDDVRVMVRYPENERRSLGNLDDLRIRGPYGLETPFREVARVRQGRGYSTITRVDRRRAVNVTADVDPAITTAGPVVAAIRREVLPELESRFPGIRFGFEGQQKEQRETLSGLLGGFLVAAAAIYALIAIPLRSYLHPVVVMSAIPFGVVGAVWGHWIMRIDLTILSMFGLVALTGVVVNDSLVLVDFIKRHEKDAVDLVSGVRAAGEARFRAILLTSVTTFVGLVPLLAEKSMQARFLIPMAVTLAFGVIFATFITLFLVPSIYLVAEDLRRFTRSLVGPSSSARKSGSSDRAGNRPAPPPPPPPEPQPG